VGGVKFENKIKNNLRFFISIGIFGKDHLAIKAGGTVFVTSCAPLKVIPASHRNCTEDILALHDGTEILVDLISYVNTSTGSSGALK
jgi:hypothetical protein